MHNESFENDFKRARPGQRVEYFVGNLAAAVSEGHEGAIAVAGTARRLYEQGRAELFQTRVWPSGFRYVAVRRRTTAPRRRFYPNLQAKIEGHYARLPR